MYNCCVCAGRTTSVCFFMDALAHFTQESLDARVPSPHACLEGCRVKACSHALPIERCLRTNLSVNPLRTDHSDIASPPDQTGNDCAGATRFKTCGHAIVSFASHAISSGSYLLAELHHAVRHAQHTSAHWEHLGFMGGPA